MNISLHFTLQEFLQTSHQIHLVPNEEIIQNLKFLCDSVMEPIRNLLQNPIKITSGYRSKELNKKVGGHFNSNHLEGLACDFVILKNPKTFFETAALIIKNKIAFNQFIIYPLEKRFHIAIDKEKRNGVPNEQKILFKDSSYYFDISDFFKPFL